MPTCFDENSLNHIGNNSCSVVLRTALNNIVQSFEAQAVSFPKYSLKFPSQLKTLT